MKKFSLVIPVYNLANYIEKTLETICSNDLSNTELIIVNDGSTDNSETVINKFMDEHSEVTIKLVNQINGGVSSARNTGVKNAEGEYIVFIDGDDYCQADMMKIIEQETADRPDMVVWRFNTLKDENKISQKEFEKRSYSGWSFAESLLRNKNRIRIGSFAVKKQLIENINFTEGCSICEDVEFMYKAILLSERVKVVNNALYTYIIRDGSAMNVYDMKKFQAPYAIERIYEFAENVARDRAELTTGCDREYVIDSLHYGLYLTHCMFSFEACCRYLKDSKQRKEFLNRYFSEFGDIEKKIKRAFADMHYSPEVFSGKRLLLFKINRRLYTLYLCRK